MVVDHSEGYKYIQSSIPLANIRLYLQYKGFMWRRTSALSQINIWLMVHPLAPSEIQINYGKYRRRGQIEYIINQVSRFFNQSISSIIDEISNVSHEISKLEWKYDDEEEILDALKVSMQGDRTMTNKNHSVDFCE